MFTKKHISALIWQIFTYSITKNVALLTYPPDYGPNLCTNEEAYFDFIVCGAGSAGSTVASRLSEETSVTVLLLERGLDPDDTTNVEVPIRWSVNLKSSVDYQYKTEQDDNLFKGLEGAVAWIPAGRLSGGGSSINVGLYLRPHREEFDQWEREGCTDWNGDTALKYFLKAEDYEGRQNYDTGIHHIGGPLPVSPYLTSDKAMPVFAKGLEDMGLAEMDDLSGDPKIGYGYADSTTRQGLRWSAFKSYVSIATFRTNFFFARNVFVRRVVMDEQTKTAIGVEITAPNGKRCVVRARKEVILSLGAFATPHVLMLSGIGPKTLLGRPVVELPAVGQHYRDHAVFAGMVFSEGKRRSPERVKMESQKQFNSTMALVNEAVSTMGLCGLMAFLDTSGHSQLPDIQFMHMRLPRGTLTKTWNQRNLMFNLLGFSETTAAHFTELNNKTDLLFAMVILLDIRSNGYLELQSADPEVHPTIHAQYLRNDEELEAMLSGIKFVQKMGQTGTFREAGYELEHIPYEACVHTEKFSDEYWRCALYQITTQLYHPACTVRMGAENDETAALTPRLRVKGVNNLRVIDASSMRNLVRCNPNASVIMMAEKGADMIKEDHCKVTDYTAHLYPKLKN